MIIELSNSQSSIEFRKLPEDDPRKRKPDITKAKSLLSWQPEVELKTGLEKTINYFDNLLMNDNKDKEPLDNVLLVNDACIKNKRKMKV